MILRIHIQYANCSPANCGPANKGDSLPLEMIIPVVTPWMKELCQGIRFGIDPSQVSSFVKIAIDTGKGKVVDVIAAAVNLGNDVFYVERGQRRIILM